MDKKNENEKDTTERTDESERPLKFEKLDNTTQLCDLPQGPYSKKVDELEALLENLQEKLSNVVAHIDYVKKKRDELYAMADTLQKSPESCGDSTKTEEGQEKKVKEVLFEIKTRTQVLKILEKKELLLSHAVLSVVSNWADEMEKNLETTMPTKPPQDGHTQTRTEQTHIMTN